MKTNSRRIIRRLTRFAALASCLLAALLAQQTAAAQIPVPVPIPRPGGTSGAKVSSEKGPQFPLVYAIGNFSAYVFARGGAPMVVEYQLGIGNTATVTVALESKKDEKFFTKRLEPTGAGITEVSFTLPEDVFGKKPAVAILTVKSEGVGQQPPDFTLYGLCMGEKACGSVGVERLAFQPGRVNTTRQEKAAYSFYPRFDFGDVYAEFERLVLIKGEPAKQLVNSQKVGVVRRGEKAGREWDGRDQKGLVSKGRHQLVVKAWLSSKDGGDWTTAWSRQRLIVE